MNPNIKYKKLVFTNDFHSSLPEGCDFIEKLHNYKQDQSLLIDIGDFSEGKSFYEYSEGLIEQEIIKSLFHVLIPGNHGFKDILELVGKVSITNCNIFKDNKLYFSEYEIININDYKVAIIGVMSNESFLSIPIEVRNNLYIKDPLEAVLNVISKIRSNVDFIVLGSHSGIEFDTATFASIKEIDILLSSHCHTIGNVFDYKDKTIRKADEEGRSIGIIDFNENSFEINIDKATTTKKYFTVREFEKFNKNFKEYSLKYLKKICDLTYEQIELLQDRPTLLRQIINYVQDNQSSNYFVNYTFIRNTDLKNSLSKMDINNLIPFDTNIIILNDLVENIDIYIETIPDEIKQMSLHSINLKDKGKINILTTDYLYDNFYPKSTEVIRDKVSVRKIFTEVIK